MSDRHPMPDPERVASLTVAFKRMAASMAEASERMRAALDGYDFEQMRSQYRRDPDEPSWRDASRWQPDPDAEEWRP